MCWKTWAKRISEKVLRTSRDVNQELTFHEPQRVGWAKRVSEKVLRTSRDVNQELTFHEPQR